MADLVSRNKARKISNQRNLVALANDTKWKEFFSETKQQGIWLEFKFIDVAEPTKSTQSWVPTGYYIESMEFAPELFVFIEWVRSDDKTLLEIAERIGLVFLSSDKKVTVYGYK